LSAPEHSRATALAVEPGSLRAWGLAVRPKTLWIATIPVIVATCLAWSVAHAFDPQVAAIALVAAVLMQVVTNLQNDVGYTERGGETGQRIGLPRATATGLLGIVAVKRAIVAAIALAFIVALPVMLRGGWPIVAMGGASVLAAVGYMGGPRPIAYTSFGELTVFLFFGLVAVLGSDWVLTGSVGDVSVLAALAIGGLAAAALAVNNHRDIAHDRLVGRRTFAVVCGEAGSRRLFTALIYGPHVLLPLMALMAQAPLLLLPLLLLPETRSLREHFLRCPPGLGFNNVLFRTFRLELWFAALLSAGAVLSRLLA
jgi:1,4-dihydroxy-2-naphthoate octaprenyltransferase